MNSVIKYLYTAAFYTVRTTEASSQSANGGDKYAQRNGDDNAQENGHPTNTEDLYTTVNKKREYQH